MSPVPIFRQTLPDAHLCVHQLLQRLSGLEHVLYLKNQDSPCIFFDAEHYYSIQNTKVLDSKRQSLNQYQCAERLLEHFNFCDEFDFSKSQNLGYFAGFIGYDFAAQQQTSVTQHGQPAVFMGHFLSLLQHTEQGWTFMSHRSDAAELYETLLTLIQQADLQPSFKLTQAVSPIWSKKQYQHAFQQVQDYIVAGDCYQINLTQAFRGKAEGSLLATAEQFWQLTDAPYSGYLRVGDFELLSCSPELFIDFKDNRKIVTKPIKGTMPRYTDPVLDEQSKQTLKCSEKDQAENVMIVDLLRNDLSVYAETGSVKTPKLFNIESFNQVHHMVSEVEATLKPEINPFDVLMSALPGGSITGAPKIRAMEIIEELEAAPRGAYCGSMGYFNADGTGSWNILIRSIQKYQDDISIWAGGGITIGSDCNAEYQECFDKVEAMLNLLNTWHRAK